MKRYLFLDLDGVCTSADYMFGARRPAEGDHRSPLSMIDPETIPHLNAIVEASGSEVVITSSWRLVHPLGAIAHGLKHHGFLGKVVGKTGYRSDGDSKTRRGLEIQDWLDAHQVPGEQVDFVILDDDRDMGPLLPHLVNTTWQHGLLAEHVPLALRILGVT